MYYVYALGVFLCQLLIVPAKAAITTEIISTEATVINHDTNKNEDLKENIEPLFNNENHSLLQKTNFKGSDPQIFQHFINKFSPLLRPIQDKVNKISAILTMHHLVPSDENIDPQNFVDKLHEKSHQLLTGAKVSIYGIRPAVENYDFPFAYRRSLKI